MCRTLKIGILSSLGSVKRRRGRSVRSAPPALALLTRLFLLLEFVELQEVEPTARDGSILPETFGISDFTTLGANMIERGYFEAGEV